MAYYLKFGIDDNVLASSFDYGSSSFILEWEMRITYQHRIWVFFNGEVNNDANRALQVVIRDNELRIDNWGTVAGINRSSLPTDITNRAVYRLENDANGTRLYQNGTEVLNVARLFNINPGGPHLRIGSYAGGGFAVDDMDLYYVKLWNDGVLVRDYQPSASNGNGSVLEDIVGNQDGQLENFPTNDSQWVFYNDGPATPINLGVTNLQATSARLTWEQG